MIFFGKIITNCPEASTNGASKLTSSAYPKHAYDEWPIWHPMPEEMRRLNSSSMYTQKRIGDKIPPCLTPFSAAKNSDLTISMSMTKSMWYTCVGACTYQVIDNWPRLGESLLIWYCFENASFVLLKDRWIKHTEAVKGYFIFDHIWVCIFQQAEKPGFIELFTTCTDTLYWSSTEYCQACTYKQTHARSIKTKKTSALRISMNWT